MATLYRRGKIWWAQWYQPGGKRVAQSTGLDKKREAARKAAEMEAEDRKRLSNPEQGRYLSMIVERAANAAKEGRLTPEKAEGYLMELRSIANPDFREITVEEAMRQWLESQETRVSFGTYGSLRAAHRHFAAHFPPGVLAGRIEDLTARHVETALLGMRAAHKLRGFTCNTYLRIMRRTLEPMVAAGRLRTNPASSVESLPTHDSTERAPFTVAEVAAMMGHPETSSEWRGAILIAAHTGLRRSDVIALSDANIHAGEIVVRPRKTERIKKIVRVPISSAVAAWLDGRDSPYFPELSATSIQMLGHQFRAIMDAAEIPRRVALPGGIEASRSFHSLRHTFNTWLAEAGIPDDVRQKLSGHSSSAVNAIYSHHRLALVSAIASLPEI